MTDTPSPEVADVDDEVQPAMSRLAMDVRESRAQLLDGFDDREAILRWFVRATAATLGRMPDGVYEMLHTQFITDTREPGAAPVIGGLLGNNDAIEEGSAREFREHFAGSVYSPAASKAMRALRADAQEVAPSREGENVDATREKHVAMRPSMSQVQKHQTRALGPLLEGFDDVEAVLQWGDVVSLATHGCIPDQFVADLSTSPVGRHVLCTGEDYPAPGQYREVREVIAAWLLKSFAEGTRERFRHAGEMPDKATNDDRSKTL